METNTGGVPDLNSLLGTVITNADQGVLYSWTLLFPISGAPPVKYELTSASGSSVTSTVDVASPGSLQPLLQASDGTFYGTSATNSGTLAVAFDQHGHLKYSMSGDDLAFDHVDSNDDLVAWSFSRQSLITLNMAGSINGAVADSSINTWKGAYQYGSVDSLAQPVRSLAPTFAAAVGGNLTGNGTALIQHSFGLFWCGIGFAQNGHCSGGDDVVWKYIASPDNSNIGAAQDFSISHRDWVGIIENEALNAFRKAFATDAIIVQYATQHVDTFNSLVPDQEFVASVVGTWPVPAFGIEFPGSAGGRIYFLAAMDEAQRALGRPGGPGEQSWVDLNLSYPPQSPQETAAFVQLMTAIGKSVGNGAAHEAGHYLERFHSGVVAMDCGLGNTSAQEGATDCENGDDEVYNFFSATGYPHETSNPTDTGGQFFYLDVPGHLIHWGPTNKCRIQMYGLGTTKCTNP